MKALIKVGIAATLLFSLSVGVQAQTILKNYQPGSRLVDGSQLNLMVAAVNGLQGNGTATKVTGSYTSTSATPGTNRAILGQNTVGAGLTMTSGNLVGVRGNVTVPSGTTVNGTSYLYGAQGKFTGGGTVVSPANITGLLGQLDVSTGTYTSGVVSAGWFDMGATASASAISTGLGTAQILRLTNTTAAVIPQAIYIEALSTNMLEVHSTGAGEAWHPVACTPGAVTGATGGLRITIDGVTKWIPLAATCS
jgi:hypothetical protein